MHALGAIRTLRHQIAHDYMKLECVSYHRLVNILKRKILFPFCRRYVLNYFSQKSKRHRVVVRSRHNDRVVFLLIAFCQYRSVM